MARTIRTNAGSKSDTRRARKAERQRRDLRKQRG